MVGEEIEVLVPFLALTAVMVFVDVMDMPRTVLLAVLLGAMSVKAYLIGMELRGRFVPRPRFRHPRQQPLLPHGIEYA